ncbi:DDE-type integrase/transposase/recombinase [Mycoplasmatota bacterium]|nr:DDE-type integrase/transposase/recombinase [Mycoplasmatota bacterium]
MVKIISVLSVFLKYLNKLLYKFILFLDSHIISTHSSKSSGTYYEPFRKFTVDGEPIIQKVEKLDYQELFNVYFLKYNKQLKPVSRRNPSKLDFKGNCPICGAPHDYIYENNIKSKQLLCKVCSHTFTLNNDFLEKIILKCPHCSKNLERIKDRNSYIIYKCRHKNCSFYLDKLKKLTPDQLKQFKKKPGKFKLHYNYRAFDINFDSLERDSMSNLNMKVDLANIRHSKHTLGLILTYYVNYGLSSRKTAAIMYDIHQVKISHQTVMNYANSVSTMIRPLLENYPYDLSSDLCGDETYVRVKGKKHYIFFFSDKIKKIITSYQVFSKRDTFSAVVSLYQTFKKYTELPKNLKVVVDGNPIYNVAWSYFKSMNINFDLFQVIGLTNNTKTDKDYRPFKQVTERLNRTFKDDYIQMNGFGNIKSANAYMVLFTTFFNFLRPHKSLGYNPPVKLEEFDDLPHMPSKWLSLIDMSYSYIN